MRFIVIATAAAALVLPACIAPAAGPEPSVHTPWSDVSAAKKKAKKKAAPKEQYLRAVPSTPPPRTPPPRTKK